MNKAHLGLLWSGHFFMCLYDEGIVEISMSQNQLRMEAIVGGAPKYPEIMS